MGLSSQPTIKLTAWNIEHLTEANGTRCRPREGEPGMSRCVRVAPSAEVPLPGRLRLHNRNWPCRVTRMTNEDLDGEDAPLFPLIGFNAGVIGQAVALRMEFAVCRDDYEAGDGEIQQFVMSPDAAIEIGTALVQQGRLAGSVTRLV